MTQFIAYTACLLKVIRLCLFAPAHMTACSNYKFHHALYNSRHICIYSMPLRGPKCDFHSLEVPPWLHASHGSVRRYTGRYCHRLPRVIDAPDRVSTGFLMLSQPDRISAGFLTLPFSIPTCPEQSFSNSYSNPIPVLLHFVFHTLAHSHIPAADKPAPPVIGQM